MWAALGLMHSRTWTQEVAPPAPMPSSLIMARVMRLSAFPPPPPPPLVSVVTPAAAPPLSYLHVSQTYLTSLLVTCFSKGSAPLLRCMGSSMLWVAGCGQASTCCMTHLEMLEDRAAEEG